MENIITTEKLSFTYDDEEFAVLHDLDISFERGKFTAIIGHNGSGKSTLAKLLCGVLEPESGKVTVNSAKHGKALLSENEGDLFLMRECVGMVFQNPDNQLVASIVEEDVAFAPENMGLETCEIRRRVDEALSAVGLSEYARHDTHKLSGGQKQRVAIAGILAMSPECVIFDESTAMLDPKGRADVINTIKKMKDELGITVILITHYMNEAACADRIVVMDDGRVILDGAPREVFSQKEKLYEVGLDLPQSTELVRRLYDDGADIEMTVLDGHEAARAIFESISKR